MRILMYCYMRNIRVQLRNPGCQFLKGFCAMLELRNDTFFSENIAACDASTDCSSKRVALLLAGGDGMRLRELTRRITGAPIPKQYCRLFRNSSLLEIALERAHLFTSGENINVVINRNHLQFAQEQLGSIPGSNIFVQPLNRDTGPGMIFALLNLERIYGDPIVAVFPTDHYVDDAPAFNAQILRAVDAVTRMPDRIAILGVVPDRIEPAYGYVLPAEPLNEFENAYNVDSFTEKPDLGAAYNIISRGGVWNTFVMVFRLSRMMELLSMHMPREFKMLFALRDAPEKSEALYQEIKSWNLSTRMLSRIPHHLILIKIEDVHWSDWGTSESIERSFRALNMPWLWNVRESDPKPIQA
jgi:mannose-1-phosphate guanylyltransferase